MDLIVLSPVFPTRFYHAPSQHVQQCSWNDVHVWCSQLSMPDSKLQFQLPNGNYIFFIRSKTEEMFLICLYLEVEFSLNIKMVTFGMSSKLHNHSDTMAVPWC